MEYSIYCDFFSSVIVLLNQSISEKKFGLLSLCRRCNVTTISPT